MNKNHIRHVRAQKKKLNDLNVLMVLKKNPQFLKSKAGMLYEVSYNYKKNKYSMKQHKFINSSVPNPALRYNPDYHRDHSATYLSVHQFIISSISSNNKKMKKY